MRTIQNFAEGRAFATVVAKVSSCGILPRPKKNTPLIRGSYSIEERGKCFENEI